MAEMRTEIKADIKADKMKADIKAEIKALTGAEAAAEAMRQIDPDVCAVFPITPQTQVMQKFADFHADGLVGSELIRVESEHSAMSSCIGASAAGARVMTATSSAGLALMWEIVGVAAGLRLPIVMEIVNRALSAPINIHCDHSDSMGARDLGWIQLYSENAQEVYENTLLAIRLAEKVLLPVMVCQDGFITSHGVERVEVFPDDKVKKFIGENKYTYSLLALKKPVTHGPLQLPDYYFETKSQQVLAMENSKGEFLKIGEELSKLTGRRYPYFDEYRLNDAEAAVVVMNSTAGTAKTAIDNLRKEGKKAGLLKLRMFRPFPYKEVANALKNVKRLTVLDRSLSFGAEPPLYGEIKNALHNVMHSGKLHSIVFGLGGRNIYVEDIENLFNKMLGNKLEEKGYIGLRE